MTAARPQRRRQRGAISVELALGLPVLIMVIMGGVHLGLQVAGRHQLGDATNYATRAAAISGTANPNQIRTAIQNRLGPDSRCTNLSVTAQQATDALGVRRLEVTARCVVDTGIGGPLLPFLGSSEVQARAAMPF